MRILAAELAFQENPTLEVMNFLNGIIDQFPEAISLASGRPQECFFRPDTWLDGLKDFYRYFADKKRITPEAAAKRIAQYGDTGGIINELIAQMLLLDENIAVNPQDILITNGAQEAMALCVDGLFTPEKDVLLTFDPTYIGITGLANLRNIEVVSVNNGPQGIDLQHLVDVERSIAARGKRAKALYVIPDFNNPTGSCLPLDQRRALLELCDRMKILIIEDNPYGMFRFEGQPLPTLKALDPAKVVLYIGTFSKTLCPGLRVGYLVSDQQIEGGASLIGHFTRLKSFLSVNTGQVAQAIVGGQLLQHQCSLARHVSMMTDFYHENRNRMLTCLKQQFSDQLPGVHWNVPEGGFFIHLTLPVVFSKAEAYECAENFSVIGVPMSFFTTNGSHANGVRLSFSNISPAKIEDSIIRLRNYIGFLMHKEKANKTF